MSRTISEYGGAKRRRRVKFTAASVLSFRCRECDTIRYVTRREADRAARPRCLRCGGTLLETDASHKRTVDKQTAMALAGGRAPASTVKADVRCPGCGIGFKTTKGPLGRTAAAHLEFHLSLNPACRLESLKGQ